MTTPPGEGPDPLAGIVSRLRDGETLDPSEIRRLRAELTKRAEQLGAAIGRAGGMDAKAAKKRAGQLAAEVRRTGMKQARQAGTADLGE